MSAAPGVLALRLDRELEAWFIDEAPGGALRVDGEPWGELAVGEFVGFFDWLRAPGGGLIGVRFSPMYDAADILPRLQDLPYARFVNDGKSVEIFFGPAREPDPDTSDDQDFSDNRIYLSSGGVVAVTFGLGDLDQAERSELEALVLQYSSRGAIVVAFSCPRPT